MAGLWGSVLRFFSMIKILKKDKKNTHSMMNVLFRSGEGERSDGCAKEQRATRFDWIQLIYKMHNEGANPPFLSSDKLFYFTPLYAFLFFFSEVVLLTAHTQKQTSECSSHEGSGSPLSLPVARCWCPTTSWGGRRGSAWPWGWAGGGGWSMCLEGHDLTCLLFCSYTLTPAECRLTDPL